MSEIEWFGPTSVPEIVSEAKSMQRWLDDVFASGSLSEDTEGYLLGRGVQSSRIEDLGIFEWSSQVITEEAPDAVFCNYSPGQTKKGPGPKGETLDGKICIPLRSPTGQVLGFEARSWCGPKKNIQYLLPESAWNPVFVGMSHKAMSRIWEGGDVWIVEGVFDMGALEHVVPTKDTVLATLRARVSEQHAQFLGRFCQGRVHMVYDNDVTGRRQTFGYVDQNTNKRRWGALDILSRVGVRAHDVPYHGGKDPGEIWDRGGAEGLRKSFKFS